MHNGVQLRLAANNILLVRKWNLAFLLLAIAWRENALTTLPEDDHWKKKKLRDRMIKQFWTRFYRKISWSVRRLREIIDLLATDKSRYFDNLFQ